jgi:hypothetical protein
MSYRIETTGGFVLHLRGRATEDDAFMSWAAATEIVGRDQAALYEDDVRLAPDRSAVHVCCDAARRTQCVCAASWECPWHGRTCRGSHE